jgi:hypothetical protein
VSFVYAASEQARALLAFCCWRGEMEEEEADKERNFYWENAFELKSTTFQFRKGGHLDLLGQL